MNSTIKIRPVKTLDLAFLWEIFRIAAHANPKETVETMKEIPALNIYLENWGQDADLGLIAEIDGEKVGAVWVRLINAYGFVADDIPELAIAILPNFQGRGIGTALMRAMSEACEGTFRAISLSVRLDNPAYELYQKLGYTHVKGSDITNRAEGKSVTMKLELETAAKNKI